MLVNQIVTIATYLMTYLHALSTRNASGNEPLSTTALSLPSAAFIS